MKNWFFFLLSTCVGLAYCMDKDGNYRGDDRLELWNACDDDDVQTVQRIMDGGVFGPKNSRCSVDAILFDKPILFRSIGSPKVFSFLLERGADVNLRDLHQGKNDTILGKIIWMDRFNNTPKWHSYFVKALDYGAGYHVNFIADLIRQGMIANPYIAELLKRNPALIATVIPKCEMLPLHFAAKYESPNAGYCGIHAKTGVLRLLLDFAVAQGKSELINTVEYQCGWGYTPLSLASNCKQKASLLVRYNADIKNALERINKNGEMPNCEKKSRTDLLLELQQELAANNAISAGTPLLVNTAAVAALDGNSNSNNQN